MTDHEQNDSIELSDFDRDAILTAFLAESIDGLNQMEHALLELETHPLDDELLHNIFRVAHTIKGNASALDLGELAGFAHVIEDLLEILRSEGHAITPELVNLLLQATDALRVILPEAISGAEHISAEHQDLRKKIAKEVQGRSTRVIQPEAMTRPSPNTQAAAGAAKTGSARRTLRADIDKLDNMLNLTGEIAIAQGRLRGLLERLDPAQAHDVIEIHREVERLQLELQEQVMKVRMVPVGPLFRQFARSVRDIAQTHDKAARLEVSGEDVEIDTTVLEYLKDPIMHMLRNAIDHGLESPEERLANGKDRCGLIRLSAEHSAGNIVIRIGDDGAGFNRVKIAQKAKKLGLIGENEWLPEPQLFRLVFRAGFSTAETVTDLSGRGVGMDVVQRNIDAIRGSIDVESEPGKGSTITIRLPLTLAIIEGFAVRVGDDTFVIPMDFVTECLELSHEHAVDGDHVLNLRGKPLPYLRLRDIFQCGGAAAGRENVVVIRAGENSAGIAVDTLLGASQTVIKPLGKIFQNSIGIAGSTILGDGKVGLILDVPGLINRAAHTHSQPVVRA
jgi:two-component system chemotaxis sensor kinase CheA